MRTTFVPVHPGEFPRWLFKKNLKDAGLSENTF
jgi:hypothetical protein